VSNKLNHIVYKEEILVVTGSLMQGFDFYGPFATADIAREWASKNMEDWKLERVYKVPLD
jgi:hypothetical protein